LNKKDVNDNELAVRFQCKKTGITPIIPPKKPGTPS
jgi:hypothetical protein